MKTSIVAGAIAAVVVFAGVVYLAREPAAVEGGEAAAPADAAKSAEAVAPAAPVAVQPPGAPAPAPLVRPAVTDPRLAALMGDPNDDRVERIAGPDGRVIREIDSDPNSAGYRKPLREFSYAGDKVVAITAYKYFGGQTQVIRVAVTYKPDGSVDRYREETSYVDGKGG